MKALLTASPLARKKSKPSSKPFSSDAEGKFDRKAYTEFLEEKLGGLGLDSRGFNHYIRDILTAQNLSNLIGGGLTSDPEIVRASHLNETQTITGQQISLVSTKFENDQNPTEEEIKTYWEENQANYNSDEKRSVSYIKIEPDWDATLADVEKKKVEAEEARKKAEAERKAKEEDAKEEKKKAERAAKKANEASAKEKETREEPTPEVGKEAPAPETTDEEPEGAEGAEGEEGEQGDPAPAHTETKEEAPSTPVVPTTPPAPTTPAAPVTSPSPTATEITAVAPTTPKPNKVKPAAPAKPVTPPAPEKEKTAKEKLNGVQKRDAVKKLSPDANTVWQLAYDGAQDGKDFAATVKDGAKTLKNAKHTYVAAELFSKDDAPEALKARVTDAGIGTLADVIFKLPAKGAADEKISNPYRTDDGYFVIQLGEVIPSEPLSYEDAKVKATVDLKKQLAREALKKRAEEVHEKLAAGLKEGKTFEELAKAEELTVKPVAGASKPVVPAQYRSRGITFPTPPAFDAGKGANANSLAEIHFTPDEESPETALLVFVEKREFNEDEAFSSGLEEAIEGQNTNIRLMAFQAWLENQYMRNNVQVLQQPRH